MNTLKLNSKNVKMVAHRGASSLERENTYPAFVAAGNRSYYGIETDIHRTADGQFVVIHDETTDRVSLGHTKVNVEEVTADVLSGVVLPDVDGSFDRRDIRLPMLKDYISICKKYEKYCVLELKNAFTPEDIKRIVEEIESLGYLDHVIFISFCFENCTTLRSFLPDQQIQWLTGNAVTDELIKTLADNKLDLDILYTSLTKEGVEKLHAAGITVNCWTCDTIEDGEKLVDMGVDFITSNTLE